MYYFYYYYYYYYYYCSNVWQSVLALTVGLARRLTTPSLHRKTCVLVGPTLGRSRSITRKSDLMHHHHHHHHPEGVVYRGFCLNSATVAVSKLTSRRWWCIESVFPITYQSKGARATRPLDKVSRRICVVIRIG